MYRTKLKFLWNLITYIVLFCCLFMVVISPGYCFQIRGMKNDFHPGDAIRINIIEIFQSPDRRSLDISGDYKINSLGNVTLPLIGPVKVVDKDRASMEKYLMEKYSPYFKEPYVTVIPLIRVVLMGAFNQPGSYRISPQSSLWELIELAGGPSENCDLKSMRVERGGEVVIRNLLTSFEKGHSLEDIDVNTGDQIIVDVKRGSFGFREIMNFSFFIMSALTLYLQIRHYY